MKAIIWTKYGPPDVLQLQEIEKPAPKDNEVLVKIHAATVTTGDCEFRSLKLPVYFKLPLRLFVGLRKPIRNTILGQEFSGEIVSAGKNVRQFRVGDEVFGSTGFRMGAYAEYICLPEEPGAMDGALARKPVNLTYDEAAAIPVGGLEALHFIRQGNLHSGQRLLINGAGGSIGTIAVQLAKYHGVEVTAVDSAGKLDMLRSIGADRVIDYSQEDFTKSGQTYDVIFDVVGKSSFSGSLRSLNENGIYLIGNPGISHKLRGSWTLLTTSKKVISGTAIHKAEDLIFLKELIEAGKLKPVIDRRYLMEQTIEAHRYVESGQKKGNVVLAIVAV